jgi:ABC-2 type transport system permease protein
MNVLRIYRYGLLVGARDFAGIWSWQSWAGGWMVRILANVLLWGLMGRLLGSAEKLEYLLIGNAVVAGVGSFTVAAATWDRMDGTYPLLVIAPSSLVPAMLGRTSIWMFGWVASALLSSTVVLLAFDLHAPWPGILAVPCIIALLCAGALFMTVFFGALASLAPRLRNIINTALITIFAAFCGVSVPVSFWPDWVQFIAALLPVTHGLQAIRLLLHQGATNEILHGVILEILVGLGWLFATVVAFDRLAERGRADGSIQFVN